MKNYKKILGLCLVVVFAVACVTGCGCQKKNDKKDDETKENYNTNEGVIEDKEVGGLKLTNTSLVSEEYSSTLVTLVTNPTDKTITAGLFKIHVKDKDGNEITTLPGYVGGEVPAGESREITSNVDMNLDNAYKIEYEIVDKFED